MRARAASRAGRHSFSEGLPLSDAGGSKGARRAVVAVAAGVEQYGRSGRARRAGRAQLLDINGKLTVTALLRANTRARKALSTRARPLKLLDAKAPDV